MKIKFCLSSLFLLLMLCGPIARAQTDNSWRLSFGIDAGLAPTDAFKYTLGGDIRLEKDIDKHFAATLTTGFTHFFEKDHFDGFPQYGSPYNVIPVKAGVKYFVTNNFYLGGEAGAGLAFEQWGTSFLWSPSVGLAFKNGIDLSVKYEDYTKDKSTKSIGLRLGYGFGTRKLAPHKKTNSLEGWDLGLALNPGLVAGSSEFVMGTEVSLNRHLIDNLEATASVGYMHFFKTYPYGYYSSFTAPGTYNFTLDPAIKNVVPIKAGLRLFLGDQFYIGGEAGVGITSRVTSFVYTPSLGLRFKNGLDIGTRYDHYSSDRIPNTLTLKLGYHFKLN
ncbi:hypothetical protein [Mucilaginibacter sp. 22184]|uniref:hypothetical protein n=1 Tax=Mucilaginibacter sp. 22184 TaxID=3453887 RepID=UPI003F87BB1D